MKKRTKLYLGISAIVVVAVLVGIFLVKPNIGETYVPPEFVEARDSAKGTGDSILRLTDEYGIAFSELQTKDNIGDSDAAAEIAGEQVTRLESLDKKAKSLLGYMIDMATHINEIQPASARNIGKEAIALGAELIQRLTTYSDLNKQFLIEIEKKLNGEVFDEQRAIFLQNQINQEVQSINSLNDKYNQLMQQFDKITNLDGNKEG